jgi:hypothetical protein
VDVIVPTTALANRPNGRRTITGYLTYCTSLSPRAVAANYIGVESAFELTSDNSPIIATIGAHALPRVVPPPTLTTNHTDWDVFRAYIAAHIDLNLRIKQRSELDDATHHFTTLLQDAAWHSTQPPRVICSRLL